MSFIRSGRVNDPLLVSVEEHARSFAMLHPELKADEVHEVLEAALDRGLVEFDIKRIQKPEVREGENVQDDPARLTREAADRVLNKLHKLCRPRWEVDD